jgi:hypothetical protein
VAASYRARWRVSNLLRHPDPVLPERERRGEGDDELLQRAELVRQDLEGKGKVKGEKSGSFFPLLSLSSLRFSFFVQPALPLPSLLFLSPPFLY